MLGSVCGLFPSFAHPPSTDSTASSSPRSSSSSYIRARIPSSSRLLFSAPASPCASSSSSSVVGAASSCSGSSAAFCGSGLFHEHAVCPQCPPEIASAFGSPGNGCHGSGFHGNGGYSHRGGSGSSINGGLPSSSSFGGSSSSSSSSSTSANTVAGRSSSSSSFTRTPFSAASATRSSMRRHSGESVSSTSSGPAAAASLSSPWRRHSTTTAPTPALPSIAGGRSASSAASCRSSLGVIQDGVDDDHDEATARSSTPLSVRDGESPTQQHESDRQQQQQQQSPPPQQQKIPARRLYSDSSLFLRSTPQPHVTFAEEHDDIASNYQSPRQQQQQPLHPLSHGPSDRGNIAHLRQSSLDDTHPLLQSNDSLDEPLGSPSSSYFQRLHPFQRSSICSSRSSTTHGLVRRASANGGELPRRPFTASQESPRESSRIPRPSSAASRLSNSGSQGSSLNSLNGSQISVKSCGSPGLNHQRGYYYGNGVVGDRSNDNNGNAVGAHQQHAFSHKNHRQAYPPEPSGYAASPTIANKQYHAASHAAMSSQLPPHPPPSSSSSGHSHGGHGHRHGNCLKMGLDFDRGQMGRRSLRSSDRGKQLRGGQQQQQPQQQHICCPTPHDRFERCKGWRNF